MYDLSWLNPTPHAIAVYASQPLSPVATQHSLPSGRYSLLGPDFHRLDRTSFVLAHFAVGTRVTSRPPPRSVRAAFPHTAPTSGNDGSKLPYANQRPVPRLSGSESGTCLVGRIPLGPRPWLHQLRSGSLRFVRRLHSYYGRVRLLVPVHHRLRLLAFPMRTVPLTQLLTARREISQVPMRSLCT